MDEEDRYIFKILDAGHDMLKHYALLREKLSAKAAIKVHMMELNESSINTAQAVAETLEYIYQDSLIYGEEMRIAENDGQ